MRLWRARVHVYESQLRTERRLQRAFAKEDSPIPLGSLVMLRVTHNEKKDYTFKKLRPHFTGPWVVIERFSNGVTYRVRDLHFGLPRQVAREQMRVIDIPGKDDELPEEKYLKRIVVPAGVTGTPRITVDEEHEQEHQQEQEQQQDTPAHISNEAPATAETYEEVPEPDLGGDASEEEVAPPLEDCADVPAQPEPAEVDKVVDEEQPASKSRYGFRQVPDRLARAAAERMGRQEMLAPGRRKSNKGRM